MTDSPSELLVDNPLDLLARDLENLCLEKQTLEAHIEEEKAAPLPDLIVTTADGIEYDTEHTPAPVVERLAELGERRKEIEAHWKSCGRTKAYIPNTAEARRMKMKAKLQHRAETKHLEVVTRSMAKYQEAIVIDPSAMTLAKPIPIE